MPTLQGNASAEEPEESTDGEQVVVDEPPVCEHSPGAWVTSEANPTSSTPQRMGQQDDPLTEDDDMVTNGLVWQSVPICVTGPAHTDKRTQAARWVNQKARALVVGAGENPLVRAMYDLGLGPVQIMGVEANTAFQSLDQWPGESSLGTVYESVQAMSAKIQQLGKAGAVVDVVLAT